VSNQDEILKINDMCYLDTKIHTVTIQLERVTVTLFVDEFLDFYNSINEVKEFFSISSSYIIGQDMDAANSGSNSIIIPKPEEDEYC